MVRRKVVARAVDDGDEERIVYRDLAVPDGSHSLLLSPDAPVRPKTPQNPGGDVREKPRDLFGRQALFRLDGSDEEGEEGEEDNNPFAALLEPSRSEEVEVEQEFSYQDSGSSSTQLQGSEQHSEGLDRLAAVAAQVVGSASQQVEVVKTATSGSRMKQKQTKRLSFETADSRPARWGVRSSQPSARDTKNRRKSLSTLKRRSLDVSNAGGSRRWSASAALPNAQASQCSDEFASERSVPKKPRLSDVLHRATTLSQQSQQRVSESFVGETQTGYSQSLVDDSILDTDRQMKSESFTPHIFLPSKVVSIPNTRRSKSEDGILSKIRGDLGDALRKAIRRSNRETTLLRSDGQSLLQNQAGRGAVERIQDRGYVTLRITSEARSGQDRFFECVIRSFTPDVKDRCPTPTIANEHVQVVLSAHTCEFVKPAPGVILKIYEPFCIVPKAKPAGLSDLRTTWFLVSTHLAEVVTDSDANETKE